jgi:hypothetical protein
MFVADGLREVHMTLELAPATIVLSLASVAFGADDFQFDVTAGYRYGEINGFLQTPSAGATGTTSLNRPTIDELGRDNVDIYDLSLTARFGPHTFNAGGQIIRLDGDAVVQTDLISQGNIFPAGSLVSSDIQLDWYRFGYQYEFWFDLGEDQWMVAPGADFVLFDFHYELETPAGASGPTVDRSYMKGGARIGGTAEWRLSRNWSLEGGGYWGIPIDGTAEILSVEVIGRWRFWTDGGFSASIFAGIGYEEIEYEDDQQLPNHIDVEMGPLLIAGLTIKF